MNKETIKFYRNPFIMFVSALLVLSTNISCNSENWISEPDGEMNGHGYVDLGLPSGTLWATMNVGANSVEDHGEHYAWGETEPKMGFSWLNYKYYKGDKYSTPKAFPELDELKKIGEDISGTQYDVAHVKWEGTWKMPTKAQIDELQDTTLCTWTWTTYKNGVKGYKVTSKINSKSIFLPAAGLDCDTGNDDGFYQSSSLCLDVPSCNYFLCFYSGDHSTNGSSLFYGRSVRPVICANSSIPPVITCGRPIYNDNSTASVFGSLLERDWSGVLNHGVCWNTSGSPTVKDNFIVAGHRGVSSFNTLLKDLKEGTTYYIRTYATNNVGTSYSKEIVYTHRNTYTQNNELQDGHEYVDLGLPSGTKWATKNIGSTAPEGYGDKYAWGETEIKSEYNWTSYKYFFDNNGNDVPYDDKWEVEHGELTDIGNDISGTLYDVAHVKWGGAWEMPTKDQMEELQNSKYCEWVWTYLNGIKGYNITSKLNGKSIFLPAFSITGRDYDCQGEFWSSSLDSSKAYSTFNLVIYYSNHYIDSSKDEGCRCDGKFIRPVTK